MNDRYMRELRRYLHCSRKAQKRLLDQFTTYQRSNMDSTPDYDQMVTMFGPPNEMAQTLMEEVTPAEAYAYHHSRLRVVAVGITACIIWVLFTGYVYWMKTIPIEHSRAIVEQQTTDTIYTEEIE